MENTMEDLTVNQQQAQFTAQQQAQGFANTMQSLRSAAGGSGIAALAQSLAGQQSLAVQQASASIGAQEARNQQLAAGQASRLQAMERQGAEQSRALKARMSETELAMAMQEQAAANKAKQEAIASAVGGAVNLGTGLAMGAVGDFKSQFNIGGGGEAAQAAAAEVARQPFQSELNTKITQNFLNSLKSDLPGVNITPDYREQAEQTITENYLDYYNKYFGNGY
jgi:hypothetical protein